MKKLNLLWITASIVFLLPARAKAESAILSICNQNTDRAIYATYMRQVGGGSGWQSNGWFKVEASTCRDLDFGNYVGNAYVQAEDEFGAGSWGEGPVSYCVHKTDGFSINNADTVDCSDSAHKKVNADTIVMTAGKNVWNVYPNFATVTVCNRNSTNDIYAAIARKSDGAAESEGWYFLPTGKCQSIFLGNYTGPLSYYAEFGAGQLTWTGNAPAFCVNRTSKFKISNAEDASQCTDASLKMVAAREVDIHLGNNTVEFEPITLPTTLRLCNNTSDKTIRAARALTGADGKWLSAGWTPLAPHECRSVDLGTYSGSTQLYAEWNDGAIYWGSGPFNFCVNRMQDFTLSDAADQKTCNSSIQQKMVPAFEFSVVPGTNTFSFN